MRLTWKSLIPRERRMSTTAMGMMSLSTMETEYKRDRTPTVYHALNPAAPRGDLFIQAGCQFIQRRANSAQRVCQILRAASGGGQFDGTAGRFQLGTRAGR